jgi:DNA-binding NarL/FixJ family response regulator
MRILIADDDPIIRRLMRELLVRHLDYEVVEAINGLKAWQALNSGLKPDVCILDLLMPEMGGLKILCRLRGTRRFPRQKVILCSTIHDRATVVQAGSLEVEGYLVKPFTAWGFLELVKKVCDTGREPGRPASLEPVETSLKRLGIGNDLYRELVNAFTADVRDLLAKLSDGAALANRKAIELRLGSVRGAGLSLGAGPTVAAIRKIESALTSGDASALATSLESLKEENDRVIAAFGGTVAPLAPPVEIEQKQATAPPEPCSTEPTVRPLPAN